MQRAFLVSALVLLAGLVLSCSGTSDLDDTEAGVYLTVTDIDYGGGAFVSICLGSDAFVEELTITSHAKDPNAVLTSAQDVTLTRWTVTPYRTDGGTVASPMWQRDLDIYVPADGETTLEGFNYYPADYYDRVPLSYLWPSSTTGGIDPETGEMVIRQAMRVHWYGRTNSGKDVDCETILEFEFKCMWGG